ncbi:hypothetical protein [Streptomyces sp. BF23-18]|uniref:hypothetical protein n=1 Tax=unclassified Streptomyces TaxID=2593676 RepID=UPI0034E3ABC6
MDGILTPWERSHKRGRARPPHPGPLGEIRRGTPHGAMLKYRIMTWEQGTTAA